MLRLSRAHGISIVAATRSSSRDSKKERDCSLSEISQRNESQDCSSTAVQMRNASTSGGSEAVVNNDVEPDASCAQSPDPAQSTNPPHDAEKGNTSKFEKAAFLIREGEHNRTLDYIKGRYSKMAFKILHHPVYYTTHLVLSILLVLLALVETPGGWPLESTASFAAKLFELLILIYLTAHIILNFLWHGSGFQRQSLRESGFQRQSLRDHVKLHGGRMLQTIILVEMILEVLTLFIRQQNHLRLIRVLRPIFFVDNLLMKGVRRELWGIFKSLKHILDVMMFLFFIIFLFALMAFYAFAEADRFYYSSFRRSFVSLFILLTTANNPDVTLRPYYTFPASPLFFVIYFVIAFYFMNNMRRRPRRPRDEAMHDIVKLLYAVCKSFRDTDMADFKEAYLHKRRVLNKAYDVLAKSSNGIIREDFTRLMQHYQPRRVESAEVLCMFKMLCNATDNEKSKNVINKENFLAFYEVRDLRWKQVKDGEKVRWYQHTQNNASLRWLFKACNHLVQHESFKLTINLIILVNAVLVAVYVVLFDDAGPEERYSTFRRFLPFSFVFVVVYCVEILLRMIGYGVYDYFRKAWNVVDFLIILISLICIILELADSRFAFLAIVRPLKLFRLLKFKRKYRHIVSIVIVLIPRLLSVGVFAGIVYYVYSIIGIEFLSGRVFKGCCNESWYNVGAHFVGSGTANTTEAANSPPDIFYIMNFDNILRSYVTLYTLMIINNWFIIMEGFASQVKLDWLVRLYFMSFVFTTLVIFEVVLVFVVDGFELMIHPCQDHGEFYCHSCPSPERKSITLTQEDFNYLEELIQQRKAEQNHFSSVCSNLKFRRSWKTYVQKEKEVDFVGHYPNTKHHLRLQLYREEQKDWISQENTGQSDHKGAENVNLCNSTQLQSVLKNAWKYIKEMYKWITD